MSWVGTHGPRGTLCAEIATQRGKTHVRSFRASFRSSHRVEQKRKNLPRPGYSEVIPFKRASVGRTVMCMCSCMSSRIILLVLLCSEPPALCRASHSLQASRFAGLPVTVYSCSAKLGNCVRLSLDSFDNKISESIVWQCRQIPALVMFGI